jgi:hypothetical protein
MKQAKVIDYVKKNKKAVIALAAVVLLAGEYKCIIIFRCVR